MKTIETSRFGKLEIEEDKIFKFIVPILGFEHLDEYILIDHAPDSPFKWLQAVNDLHIAFIVTNPVNFGVEYEFVIAEEDTQKIKLTDANDALVLTIVYIPQGAPHLMTANLAGPIIINAKSKLAMQLVLSDSRFTTKHRLLPNADPKQSSNSGS